MAMRLISDERMQEIASAIRSKTGKADIAIYPKDMAAEILSIEGGSDPTIEELSITSNGTYTVPEGVDGYNPITVNVAIDGEVLPEEMLHYTGGCSNKFVNNNWNWVIEQYGNRITTSDITNTTSMFSGCTTLTSIPFDINLASSGRTKISNTFYNCSQLTTIPYINGVIEEAAYLFYGCNRLREIPEDWADKIDLTYPQTYTYGNMSQMFNNCYSLRKIPASLMKELWNITSSGSYAVMSSLFNNCYALDEIVGLPFATDKVRTTNEFGQNPFTKCGHIKNLTFAVQEDGTPYVVSWKGQTINLGSYIGYVATSSNITTYNSGLTEDKLVATVAENDATYLAFKDTDDWWTTVPYYSRYNHDSAVATINSLPDTSAYITANGGTNTIKFLGTSGQYTTGGAINELTAEEIAVATAKGWTVTLV